MKSSGQVGPDYSLLSRLWSGIKLITSQIAIEIARIVHRESEGQAVFDRSGSLSVVEDGEAWVWLILLTQVYLLRELWPLWRQTGAAVAARLYVQGRQLSHFMVRGKMTDISNSEPDAMPIELAREIARQGDIRLSALMALATAADLRATTLCGILGAGSVGIAAAALAVLVSEHSSVALIVGGAIVATGLYVAAMVAAFAGAPRDFYIGGGNPASLRQWSWAAPGWRGEREMLEATAMRYANSIAENRNILDKNTWRLNAALWIGWISPILGIAAVVFVHFRPV